MVKLYSENNDNIEECYQYIKLKKYFVNIINGMLKICILIKIK